MVISNLNTTLITDRLSIIIDSLAEMKTLRKQPREEFFSDKRNPRAAESYLRDSSPWPVTEIDSLIFTMR